MNNEENDEFEFDHIDDSNDNNDDNDDDEEYVLEDLDVSTFQQNQKRRESGSLGETPSFGLGRGRSAPMQRKAMGKSGSGSTSVYVCTNCGAEFVKWLGRCPTCREWNTIQEYRVGRSWAASKVARPTFAGDRGDGTWLPFAGGMAQPVPITNVYQELGLEQDKQGNFSQQDVERQLRQSRIQVPNDDEMNTVLGGGIMPGSLLLLGGDPGVGKSTLLLQTAAAVASTVVPPRGIGMGKEDRTEKAARRGPVLYVSGEENSVQIASRAARLGITSSQLLLLCETNANDICETVASYAYNDSPQVEEEQEEPMVKDGALGRQRPVSLVVIDSIQTMTCDAGGASAAGGVTQVRETAALFLRLAKSTGVAVLLVGHVTKSGDVAGPRTVEHMVDAVLYLEGGGEGGIGILGGGGGGPNVRMLRAVKNRFGSSDEVGVYEMQSNAGRLVPVYDPSSLLLSTRLETTQDVQGCAVSLIVEGLRPMAVEIQALVAPSAPGISGGGRRTVNGFATSRLLLLLAVLQKRCGISIHRQDVYVNVVGGIQLGKSKSSSSSLDGSDLAVAVAVVSSLTSIAVRADTAFVGEVGLLGELRPMAQLEKRVVEAQRMGFSRIVTPPSSSHRQRGGVQKRSSGGGMQRLECATLWDALHCGLVQELPKRQKKRKTTLENGKNQRGSFAPSRVQDLELNDPEAIIVDDEEDDDDYGSFA